MSIEAIKAISMRGVIENETGLRFKHRTLECCPFCGSGSHFHRNSDSAFSITERNHTDYFYCFSCGTGGSILDFVMKYHELGIREAAKYIEEKYLKLKSTFTSFKRPSKFSAKEHNSPEPEYIPVDWVKKSMKAGKNNLTNWLENQYGKDKAEKAVEHYQVGSSKRWKGATVFYNIDEEKLVRRGKIMLYDSSTGKRNREMNPTSVHSVMKLKEKPETCLFGMHLINEFPNKVIAVVESEKTAVIMSIVCPHFLWMATGGLSFLNPKLFKPLKAKDIVLYPDLGESTNFGTPFEQWERKLPEIKKYVKSARVFDLMERKCSPEQRKKGFDIADFFPSHNTSE